MTEEFNRWWDADELTQTNPYADDTPVWWAWEGWQAAQRSYAREAPARAAYVEIERLRGLLESAREYTRGTDCYWDEAFEKEVDAALVGLCGSTQ